MIGKEQLLGIRGLKLSGVVDTMSDSQLAGYVQKLNTFVDRFPKYAEELTAALEAGRYTLLGRKLTELHDMLSKLGADTLAAECQKQARTLSAAGQTDVDQDALEAFVENFIQGVSALSIDIQMAAHKRPSGPPARVARPAAGRAEILAVDNAVMFLNTLQKLLAGAPYNLNSVTSGADALRFLENRRVDIILLDIEMPDMDGYELARRIKKSGNRAPILFITANSAREYVDRAVAVGAAGLLVKPLRINQLLAKLKEVL